MATIKERDEFIAQMVRALPNVPVQHVTEAARLVLRHAKTHGRLSEMSCNGHPLQSVCPPNGCDMQAWNARANKAQDGWDAFIEKRVLGAAMNAPKNGAGHTPERRTLNAERAERRQAIRAERDALRAECARLREALQMVCDSGVALADPIEAAMVAALAGAQS